MIKRLLIWLLLRSPAEIKPGQMFWDYTGHVSHSDCRAVYVAVGNDHEGVWHCGRIDYYGQKGVQYLGGPTDYPLGENELMGMGYVGRLPSWKMRLILGPYKHYLLDRKWVEGVKQ